MLLFIIKNGYTSKSMQANKKKFYIKKCLKVQQNTLLPNYYCIRLVVSSTTYHCIYSNKIPKFQAYLSRYAITKPEVSV